MFWKSLITALLPLIIELIGNLEAKETDCPEGACPPVASQLTALQSELDQVSTQGVGDFLKCLDFQRLFAAVSEIVSIMRDANAGCPPIDTSPGVGTQAESVS
ncbi:hypothetical protein Pla52o_35290 [Novipirellula galeiformis]|uniref:Uncharacterized protein n=1 Tax=Novipirellula galeiformis TaxID=2528004 RepID=A0A5C6CCE7_9BACT|nr:hypothetical protein [Novipirellula galeiformis]TWU22473.1 hypothetical protein Pla52o_35290 [Novipirellula galeiformis]